MLGLDAGMSHRNIKRCLDTFEITSELGSETTIRMGLIAWQKAQRLAVLRSRAARIRVQEKPTA